MCAVLNKGHTHTLTHSEMGPAENFNLPIRWKMWTALTSSEVYHSYKSSPPPSTPPPAGLTLIDEAAFHWSSLIKWMVGHLPLELIPLEKKDVCYGAAVCSLNHLCCWFYLHTLFLCRKLHQHFLLFNVRFRSKPVKYKHHLLIL